MEELLPYIIIGAIILYVIYTNMNSSAPVNAQSDERDEPRREREQPRYDSRDVRGRGGFGRERNQDEPASGWLRRTRNGPQTRQVDRPSSRRNDSPRVRGRGGFGRDKD